MSQKGSAATTGATLETTVDLNDDMVAIVTTMRVPVIIVPNASGEAKTPIVAVLFIDETALPDALSSVRSILSRITDN